MVAESGVFIHKNNRLGEILLNRKAVVKGQINRALQVQKSDKRFIGEILTGLGFVNEKDIVAAIAAQRRIPYIAIDRYDVNAQVLSLIPKEIACKYCLIPLDCVGNILSIVMANPLDDCILKELKELTRCEIVLFIATKVEISKAISKLYR